MHQWTYLRECSKTSRLYEICPIDANTLNPIEAIIASLDEPHARSVQQLPIHELREPFVKKNYTQLCGWISSRSMMQITSLEMLNDREYFDQLWDMFCTAMGNPLFDALDLDKTDDFHLAQYIILRISRASTRLGSYAVQIYADLLKRQMVSTPAGQIFLAMCKQAWPATQNYPHKFECLRQQRYIIEAVDPATAYLPWMWPVIERVDGGYSFRIYNYQTHKYELIPVRSWPFAKIRRGRIQWGATLRAMSLTELITWHYFISRDLLTRELLQRPENTRSLQFRSINDSLGMAVYRWTIRACKGS